MRPTLSPNPDFWSWPQLAVMLAWRLAPNGFTITRKDLAALPMERVLMDERYGSQIRFSWVTPEAANLRSQLIAASNPRDRMGVSQLQGRWQKFCVVLMWKLARDGIVLTAADYETIPADRILMAEGHAKDISYRFVPEKEAELIAKREESHEGRVLAEATVQ